MRNISFALTADPVRRQTKTVTRRLNWTFLEGGELLQPVKQGQGIPKGGHVERIGGPIRVVNVHRERLDRMTEDLAYGRREVVLEGFPEMTLTAFVTFFCDHNGCQPHDFVTRIEFSYTEAGA